jgi:hypothetical protein
VWERRGKWRRMEERRGKARKWMDVPLQNDLTDDQRYVGNIRDKSRDGYRWDRLRSPGVVMV